MAMFRIVALIGFFLVSTLRADSKDDDCTCNAVLENGLRNHVAKEEVSRLQTKITDLLEMSLSQLEQYKNSKNWGADAVYGIFSAGLTGSTEEEKLRDVRFKLASSLSNKLHHELISKFTSDTVDPTALQKWLECKALCIRKQLGLGAWGLQLHSLDRDDEDTVRMEVSWKSQDDRARDVEIEDVYLDGLNMNADLKLKLKGQSLGTISFAVSRADAGLTEPTISIFTKTAGCIVYKFPKQGGNLGGGEDLNARWNAQVVAAFAQNLRVVASQGVFTDRIRVAWRPFEHPDYAKQKGTADRFIVQRFYGDKVEKQWNVDNGTTLDDTDENLKPFLGYKYCVIARWKADTQWDRDTFGGWIDSEGYINRVICDGTGAQERQIFVTGSLGERRSR